MDFKNLKSWMPMAGFAQDGTFYRDLHHKKKRVEYTLTFIGDIRPITKANGMTVGQVAVVHFVRDPHHSTRAKNLFSAVGYYYAIPGVVIQTWPSHSISYLGFFKDRDEAWVAMCDAARIIEQEVRADMKAGRANRYFTTEHLNATYYPFSGVDRNPDDNGGFYDINTPLINEMKLPATTA